MRLNSVLCINFVSSDGDVDSYIFIPLSIEIELQNNETRQGEDNIVDKNYTNLIDMTIWWNEDGGDYNGSNYDWSDYDNIDFTSHDISADEM